MAFASTLLKIRELAAANNATGHWLLQRFTAILLIPLSYWLIIFVELISTASYQTTLTWLTSPLNAIALISWTLAVFYHAVLGLQVVIEDYVPQQPLQKGAILAVYSVFSILALVALAALFKIILTG